MAEERQEEQRIEVILTKMRLLNQDGLMRAINEKRKYPHKEIVDILLEKGIITEFDYIRALGIKYNLSLVNLATQKIHLNVLKYISEEDVKRHNVIPVHETEYVLYLAVADPLNQVYFERVSQVCGKQISLLLATKADIRAAIDKNYTQKNVNNIMGQIEDEFGEDRAEDAVAPIQDIENEDNSIVRAVSLILDQAYQKRASDVHIEPHESEVIVRMRIDGQLVETMAFDKKAFGHLLSRFKVIGGLDIAEKRVPQDGRMSIYLLGVRVNMRISTLPTQFGEKIVVRLLGTSRADDIYDVSQLRMDTGSYARFIKSIDEPNGIVLITGPTGSGKSTTVYSALKRLSKPTINIITIEDPVEKVMPGINQVQINQKAGLTFSVGLRSILRQDPDIIMIGEIRDNETAQIAAQAAITGHLVIATLHTNDAASAFMRMMDMDVEPYIVASSITGVVAQRLVRKVCKYCKEEYVPEDDEWGEWAGERPEVMYKGRGCPMCNNTGYRGRQGVYEVINMDINIKKMVLRKADDSEIKAYLKELGMKTLADNVQELIHEGTTTLEELKKVKKIT